MDIEPVAKETPEQIVTVAIALDAGLLAYMVRQLAIALGLDKCQSRPFDAIVQRMNGVFRGSDLGPDNVTIDYSHVGMGFAGRPGGDIVPVVTVRLDGVTFDFMVLSFIRPLMFYGSEQPTTSGIPMPPFTATLSGEDLNSAGPS